MSFTKLDTVLSFSFVLTRSVCKCDCISFILDSRLSTSASRPFMALVCFSKTYSSSNSCSLRFSIYCSFGSSEAFISCVLWVSTCLVFCRSLILNLYVYSSFSFFLSLSCTSILASSNSLILVSLSFSRISFSRCCFAKDFSFKERNCFLSSSMRRI